MSKRVLIVDDEEHFRRVFRVKNPRGWERDVVVEIPDEVVVYAERITRRHRLKTPFGQIEPSACWPHTCGTKAVFRTTDLS